MISSVTFPNILTFPLGGAQRELRRQERAGFDERITLMPQVAAGGIYGGTNAGAAGVKEGAEQTLGLKTNLIGSWELNESSNGSTAVARSDAHTNGLTLSDSGNVESATGIGGTGAAASYVANERILFNTSVSYFDIGDTDWTAFLFVYPTDLSNVRGLFSPYPSDFAGYQVQIYTDGTLGAIFANAGGGRTEIYHSSPLVVNTWYGICIQHDAQNNLIKLSINGATPETTAIADGGTGFGSDYFSLGHAYVRAVGSRYFRGRIAKFSIWRSAAGGGGCLTSDQIAQLYNAGAGRTYSEL